MCNLNVSFSLLVVLTPTLSVYYQCGGVHTGGSRCVWFLRLHVGDIYWLLKASAHLKKDNIQSDVTPSAR